MAEHQKEKKKSLEEEIQEELSTKKPKNDKDDLRKRAELYQKSQMSSKKKKVNYVEPIQPSSSKHDTYESNYYNSQTKSSSSSDQSNSKKSATIDSNKERSAKGSLSNTRKDDLPPISQVIKRRSKESIESSSESQTIDKILNSKATGGSLQARIASLSKEELLRLAKAVKKAKKEKKTRDSNEYCPRVTNEEYQPSDYRSNKASPQRPSAEPVYIPTKTKNQQEEYCPVNNYKSQTSKQLLSHSSQIRPSNNKLFDIDSLTPEEIEKIRLERMQKQRKTEETITKQSITGRESMKSNKSHKSSPPPFDRASKLNHPTSNHIDRANYPPQRPNYPHHSDRGYLPPIGKNYRRGDYDTSYNDYDEYEDEEDDMSDFIDDGNDFGTQEDVSRAIEELFPKYKKRKYQIFDDDSDIEESSYAQQMREEHYSSRVGLMEDLEEERREQEEKKRRRRKGIVSSDEED